MTEGTPWQPPGASGGPDFVPGLRLGELFFEEAVKPILDDVFPTLRYAAALLGAGSDVLGYDTVRSTDHEWGPRLQLFVADEDLGRYAEPVRAVLSERLPYTVRGYSTHFGPPDAEGVQIAVERTAGPVDHKVAVYTLGRFFAEWLGADPREELTVADWLSFPQQRLLEVTAGRVYHDGLRQLEPIRATLSFYPHDVWLYLMACQWRRIAQQEPFVGRAGEMGDDLGSRLLAATLVRDVMRLCFLIERRYAPYSKWFGTAFARLRDAPRLTPHLRGALLAETWTEREAHLGAAYETVADLHNALGITPLLEPTLSPFHGRPFRVIRGDRFVEALAEAIQAPDVRAVVDRIGLIGSADQISDNVDLLTRPELYRGLRAVNGSGGAGSLRSA